MERETNDEQKETKKRKTSQDLEASHPNKSKPTLDPLVASYQRDGYVVLPRALSETILQALRDECDELMTKGVDLIEVLYIPV